MSVSGSRLRRRRRRASAGRRWCSRPACRDRRCPCRWRPRRARCRPDRAGGGDSAPAEARVELARGRVPGQQQAASRALGDAARDQGAPGLPQSDAGHGSGSAENRLDPSGAAEGGFGSAVRAESGDQNAGAGPGRDRHPAVLADGERRLRRGLGAGSARRFDVHQRPGPRPERGVEGSVGVVPGDEQVRADGGACAGRRPRADDDRFVRRPHRHRQGLLFGIEAGEVIGDVQGSEVTEGVVDPPGVRRRASRAGEHQCEGEQQPDTEPPRAARPGAPGGASLRHAYHQTVESMFSISSIGFV